ncbi:hypothetical protein KY360_04470 [Candidatus Woesearchaeota archaeon]|nr:hypothetical protein [Candidatus Woesearchaeota archaeon]
MHKPVMHRVEEVFLVIIIVLSIMDFFEMLPADLDFAKKIVSWIAIGYLFLKASPTSIFFGNKHVGIDLAIILSYLFLIVKNILAFARTAAEEAHLTKGILEFFLEKSGLYFELYSFYIGGVLLILLSLWVTWKLDIKKPSLMHVIHEEGPPARGFNKITQRALIVFFVLLAFFVVVFNLAMEWLAMAIDAPMIMIAIFLYLFVVVRHYEKLKPENLIFKIGKFGEDFYERFISLFHYKKTLFLGITGILVFHLLTDLGIFVIPYVFGAGGALYLSQLGPGHIPMVQLMLADTILAAGFARFAIILVYVLNIFAIIFLLLMPALAWYKIFKQKEFHLGRQILAFIASSLTSFVFMPAFILKKIDVPGLAGVDLATRSIYTSRNMINLIIKNMDLAIVFVAVISLAIGILTYLFSSKKVVRKDVFLAEIAFGLLFFVIYIYHYFTSIFMLNISLINAIIEMSGFFIGAFLTIFAIINVLFYVLGFVLFMFEVWSHSHYRGKIKRFL